MTMINSDETVKNITDKIIEKYIVKIVLRC